MNLKKKITIILLYFLICLTLNVGYYWQDYNYIFDNNIINTFKNYQSISGYHSYFRPLMYFHLRFFNFLTINEFYYNLFNTISWFLSIFFIYTAFDLNKFFDERFYLLTLFPSITYSIVVSGQYITMAHAIIFLSISGFFFKKYIAKEKLTFLILFYIFFILALLTYEIVFVLSPLLFLFCYNKKQYLNLTINLSIIIICYLIYNKIFIEIIFELNEIDTRIRYISLKTFTILISNILIFFRILIFDIPHLYILSILNIFFINKIEIYILTILTLVFLFYLYKKHQIQKSKISLKLLLIIISIIFINIILLSVTNFPPFIYGNYNRGIIGLLIFNSLLLSLNINKKKLIIFSYIIIFLNIISFINIRSNFKNIETFKHHLIKDLINIDNNYQKVVVLPIGHKYNLNGEEIYETENDYKNFFYGMSLFNFYNRKYQYQLDFSKSNFLLPTRACKVIYDSKLYLNFNFPLNVLIYNQDLKKTYFLVNEINSLKRIFNKNLNCDEIKKFNFYYSQSYVLNNLCSEYFNFENNFKKFFCRKLISSFTNYHYIKKYY